MAGVSEADRAGVPELEHRLERERRAAEEQLPRRRTDLDAVAAARRGRVRAAHRLRERRQPAARARHRRASARWPSARRSARRARRSVAQFLTESVVLAMAGGVLGAGARVVPAPRSSWRSMPPNTLPSEADVRLNVPVLLFTLAVSMLSGVLFGCAPAWQVTRLNINDVLKEAGRSAVGGGRQWTAARVRRRRVRARADAARRRRPRHRQPRQARRRRSRLPDAITCSRSRCRCRTSG